MNCKICNTSVTTVQDERNGWEFFHCKSCEFIFKNPKNYVDDAKELSQYQNHNNTMESPGYVEMFEKFMNSTFEPYIDEITNVLEFGSGPGPVLAELLKQKGLKVDIYDKYFSPIKVYDDKQYDLITSTEVIEHIDNPKEIFNFFAKHIKKDGYLSIMTQFHTNDAKEFQKWWYKNDPTHICFFRPRTFEILAELSGFEVVKHDGVKSVLLKKDDMFNSYYKLLLDLENKNLSITNAIVGFLSKEITDFLIKEEITIHSKQIVIDAKKLTHLNRDSKQKRMATLSSTEIHELPNIIQNIDIVLFNTEDKKLNLVYAKLEKDGLKYNKIIIDTKFIHKKLGKITLIKTAGKVQKHNLLDKKYVVIKGKLK